MPSIDKGTGVQKHKGFAQCHLYVQELNLTVGQYRPNPELLVCPYPPSPLPNPAPWTRRLLFQRAPAGLLTLDSWLGLASGEAETGRRGGWGLRASHSLLPCGFGSGCWWPPALKHTPRVTFPSCPSDLGDPLNPAHPCVATSVPSLKTSSKIPSE